MEKTYIIKSPQRTDIIVEGDKITIVSKGLRSMINKGLSGSKSFKIKDIKSVQIKKPGFTNGYIQFGLMGDSNLKQGVFSAISDENTVVFGVGKYNEMLELKQYIENYEYESIQRQPKSDLDDLRKLNDLLEDGIISKEEFESMKRKILS